MKCIHHTMKENLSFAERFTRTLKIKKTVPWSYVISDVNGEPTAGRFYQKKLQKTSQEKFRIEKIIKKR